MAALVCVCASAGMESLVVALSCAGAGTFGLARDPFGRPRFLGGIVLRWRHKYCAMLRMQLLLRGSRPYGSNVYQAKFRA